jgi:hypothetical protein
MEYIIGVLLLAIFILAVWVKRVSGKLSQARAVAEEHRQKVAALSKRLDKAHIYRDRVEEEMKGLKRAGEEAEAARLDRSEHAAALDAVDLAEGFDSFEFSDDE